MLYLIISLVLGVIIAITIVSAKEGYEDESGFHYGKMEHRKENHQLRQSEKDRETIMFLTEA